MQKIQQKIQQIDTKKTKDIPFSKLTHEKIENIGLEKSREMAVRHVFEMHRENDTKSNIAFCYEDFQNFSYLDQRELTPKKLIEMLEGGSLHMSQSTFSGKSRTTWSAYSNSAIVIDLDYYKLEKFQHGKTLRVAAWKIVEMMRDDGLFDAIEPSYVIHTGQGINLVYLLQQLPIREEHFSGNVKFRKQVIDALNGKFRGYGADAIATDIARINKIPGTRNYKSGWKAKILDYEKINWENVRRYDLREMASILQLKRYEKKENITKTKTTVNVDLAKKMNGLTLAHSRALDIAKLLKMRKNNIGNREVALWLYAVHHYRTFQNMSRLMDDMIDLNASLSNSLMSREIEKKIIKRIRSDENKYRFTNETMIEKLSISETEQKQLRTLIGPDEKLRRDKLRKKRKRRGGDNLTPKQRKVKERQEKIKNLISQGLSKTKIAKELGISRRTVIRDSKNIGV